MFVIYFCKISSLNLCIAHLLSFRVNSPALKLPTYQYQCHHHKTDPIAADFQSRIVIQKRIIQPCPRIIPYQTNHPIYSQSHSNLMPHCSKYTRLLSRTEHSQNPCFSATLSWQKETCTNVRIFKILLTRIINREVDCSRKRSTHPQLS